MPPAHGVAERIDFLLGDLAELPAGPYDADRRQSALYPERRNGRPDARGDGISSRIWLWTAAPTGWTLIGIWPARRRSGLRPAAGCWSKSVSGQAAAVRGTACCKHGLAEVFIREDYAGIPRVVGGCRK